jgi:type I protein arginine methyltransferase
MVTSYSVAGYGSMLGDSVRLGAYVQALRQAVTPGSIVLDVGTGTGFFAVLACHLGARKVIAIEPDNAIHVARQVAAANGCAERITFIQDLSTRVQLAERADVIVSDLRGVLPLMGHHLPSLMDAQRRLLAPGGALIPRSDTLWAVLVETPKQYARAVSLGEGPIHGVNMEPTRPWMVNSWHKAQLKPEHLLAAPQQWASLDYANLEGANAWGEVAWTVERPGVGHGLLLWFDTSLVEGVGFSNAPGQPELIYGQGFFPWAHPVPLSAGDLVEATLRADLVGADYVWGWSSRVREGGPAGLVKADFRQSTFLGASLDAGQLRKRAASHRAELNEDGQIDRFILSLMDAATPAGDVARQTAAQFPGHFPTWHDALTRVGDLAEKYSR